MIIERTSGIAARLNQSLPLVVLPALFALLAYVGIEATREENRVALLWLPNAILVAWLLRIPGPRWPVYVLACAAANIAVNRMVGDSWTAAVTMAIANSAEIIFVAATLFRTCGARPDLTTLRNHGWLLVVAISGAVISGLFASTVLSASSHEWGLQEWERWLLADTLSMMVVLPISLVIMDGWSQRHWPNRQELIDWAVMIVLVLSGSLLVFGQSRFPFLFLACPLVLYAAFRTGLLGTAAAIIVITAVATSATALGYGPITLVRGGSQAKIFAFQLFLAVNFAIGLPVAALLAARARDSEALQQSRDTIQEILDNIQEVLFRTDPLARWTSLNPAWETLTGYTITESLGRRTTELLHPDELPETRMVYARLASGELTATTLCQRFIDRHGKTRHIEISVRRVTDANGEFAGTVGNIREVTREVEQAKALAESEARFRKLAECAPVGIYRANALGELTYVSAAWAAKVGKTVDQLLGNGWLETVVETPEDEYGPPWQNFQPGEVRRRLARFRGHDGADLWMESHNSAEFDETGKVIGFFGALIDQTEQRLAAERLAQSERRFQALADLAPAGIFRTDARGMTTYVNSACLRMMGLGPDEWQGQGWINALHPDDREQVIADWQKAVETSGTYRGEYRWLHADGTELWVDTVGSPEFDGAGRVTGFVGVNLDVTETRRALRALAERDQELTLLTDNVSDAVLRLSLDGVCRYASRSAGELFELPPSALIGHQMLADFHSEDDAAVRAIFADLASGVRDRGLVAFRSESRSSAGRFRWMEANCAVRRDAESGKPIEIIASIRDVSKAKKMEAELRAARQRAEDAANAKANFLANMSHEIRTPMNGVLGFADLLQRTALDPVQRGYVQMIADSGRGMMRLLNDILDFSKIEAGLMPIALESVDLQHKLNGAIQLMRPVAEEKGLKLQLDVSPDLPKWIESDPLRLRQIVLNLIGNAVKFTTSGSITVVASPDDNGRMLRIDVVDSGIGIAPEHLDTIFQQFTQADGSVARRFGGTGLGLAISSRLVDLMGGRIAVESEMGKGSTFSIWLPLVVGLAPWQPMAAKTIQQPVNPGQATTRLLIVEDNDINQQLILAMVAQAGFAADLATNGQEAVNRAVESIRSDQPYQLVLMDLQMPVLDGLTATRLIRAQGIAPDRLPIIALTANAYPEDIDACRAAGMQGHLAKPLQFDDLVQTVKRHARTATAINPAPAAPLEGIKSGGALHDKYRTRKQRLQALLAEIGSQTGDDRWEEVASALHQLAGVAGMFGEAALGDTAAVLEHELRAAASAEDRLHLLAKHRLTEALAA